MFGSPILDVAIGLVFVYLLLSLIATALRETMEAWMKSRAGQLELGIRTLLQDLSGDGLARAVYEHPLIYGLYSGKYEPPAGGGRRVRRGSSLPSYIPSASFAAALVDIVAHTAATAERVPAGTQAPPVTLDGLRCAAQRLQNEPVRRALLSAIDLSEGNLRIAQGNIEAWYDSSMDRVSGWYKRETQKILLAIGLGVAVVANVNSLAVASHLYRDQPARAALVNHARNADTALGRSMKAVRAELGQLDLPIGWTNTELSLPRASLAGIRAYPWWGNVVQPLLGWIMTGLAISLGAPFWFDLLNKFMVIRSTVKPREKSPEEGSEDRPPRQPVASGVGHAG
jgi:hypothetical protein